MAECVLCRAEETIMSARQKYDMNEEDYSLMNFLSLSTVQQ